MLEILNILDMQKQKVEAELADLTRQSNQYFLEISLINEGIANKQMEDGNLYVLEKWRDNQAAKIIAIKENLKSLQADILTSKQNYKKILAKNLAAKDMASTQYNIQALHSEEQETSRALDTFLLSKMP